MAEVPVQEDLSLESLVARVADEFLERQKRGERPDAEEYAARHPQAAPVLGEKEKARTWYDKAVQWMDKYDPRDEELQRFRAEAAELLLIKNK
jgi:hypothetical protein